MKTQAIRAMTMAGPGRLEMREYARPELQTGATLVKTLLSEVCGTDVHLLAGQLPEVPYPIIPGHFAVGEVLATNGPVPDAYTGEPLAPGDRVTFLDVYGTCGQCWHCTVAKASTRCPSRRVYGITAPADEGLLGGWSEAIYLKPGVRIAKLPPGVTPERFLGGGCGLVTALHAVERAGIRFGDAVAVQGAGPVGLNAALLAALAGATQVIVIGAPEARLAQSRKWGAARTLNIEAMTAAERLRAVREATGGRGADVTIEATGVPGAVVEGMALTRDAGTLVVAGQYTDAGAATFNPHADLNKKHLDVRGTWGVDFSHLWRALRVLERHGDTYRWEDLLTRVYPLGAAGEALADVASGRVIKAAIAPNQP